MFFSESLSELKKGFVLQSFFRPGNLAALAAIASAGAVVEQGVIPGIQPDILPAYLVYPTAGAVYLVCVALTLRSHHWQNDFLLRRRLSRLRKLDAGSRRIIRQIRRFSGNAIWGPKVKKVVDEKKAILDIFNRRYDDPQALRLTEQAMELIYTYFRVADNFLFRSKEITGVNVSEIIERRSENVRKLDYIKDSHMLAEVKRVVELDGDLIEHIRTERRDLERISVQLDSMQSTLSLMKSRMLSSSDGAEVIAAAESIMSEVEALETVMLERRKSREHIR